MSEKMDIHEILSLHSKALTDLLEGQELMAKEIDDLTAAVTNLAGAVSLALAKLSAAPPPPVDLSPLAAAANTLNQLATELTSAVTPAAQAQPVASPAATPATAPTS